jgi:peptidyl-prolyl cis-trans isomerase SurA
MSGLSGVGLRISFAKRAREGSAAFVLKRLQGALLASVMLTGLGSIAHAQTPEAPEQTGPQMLEAAAAVVNDEPITFSDVRSRARLLLLLLQVRQITAEIERDAIQRSIEALIEEAVQRQEVTRREVKVDPAEVEASLQSLAQRLELTVEEMRQRGINLASVRRQIETEIAWTTLVEGMFGSRVRISENQIKDTLDRLTAGASKVQYNVAELFVYAPDPTSRQKARQDLQQVRQAVEQFGPAAFANYAQQFSDAPSAANGGDLSWVAAGTLDPALDSALEQALGPGVIGPVETVDGLYLLQMRARRDPAVTGPGQVRLKQVLSTLPDRAQADAAVAQARERAAAAGCDGFEAAVANIPGLFAVNLGLVSESGLEANTAATVRATEVGAMSAPFETPRGPAAIMVCERRAGEGPRLPTPEQIQGSLYQSQLLALGERLSRDLKRQSTIVER